MKTDEGLKLQVMQVVSFQIKNRQTIERSQSVRVYLGDVVVTQLQHLNRHTGTNFVQRIIFKIMRGDVHMSDLHSIYTLNYYYHSFYTGQNVLY